MFRTHTYVTALESCDTADQQASYHNFDPQLMLRLTRCLIDILADHHIPFRFLTNSYNITTNFMVKDA
jgi:hypothetical protein